VPIGLSTHFRPRTSHVWPQATIPYVTLILNAGVAVGVRPLDYGIEPDLPGTCAGRM